MSRTQVKQSRYNLRPRSSAKPSPSTSEGTSNSNGPVDGGCPICLNTSTVGCQMVWSPCCKKSFHSVCLMSWCEGNSNPLCPLCRNKIAKVKVLLRVSADEEVFVTETFGYVIM